MPRALNSNASRAVVTACLLIVLLSYGHAATPNDDRLNPCDASVAVPAALEAIDQHIQERPVEVLRLALVLYVNDRRDEAMFWYYAGLLRARQQLLADPEQEDAQGFVMTEGMVGAIIETYARKDVAKLVRTISDVQAWDARTPNRFLVPIKAKGLEAKRQGIIARFESMKANLIAERDVIEARARASTMDDMMAKLRSQKCGRGG